jgi:hypothetical protein
LRRVQESGDQPERIEGALVGACVGEAAADVAAGAADLLGVAESLAATGGFDADDLRRRGLERPSKSGSAGLLLRGLPFGLLTPLDRPRLRRDAYRCVALAGADELTAICAVAVAVLTADLPRFDLATSLVRLRQSLLEDAPLALLDRFRAQATGEPVPDATDPGAVLQAVIGALDRASGIGSVVRETVAVAPVAAGLAGALAGARDGLSGVDASGLAQVPHAETAASIAHRLADRAASSLPVMGAS